MIRFGTGIRNGDSRVYALVDDERAVEVAADFISFIEAGEQAWREAARRATANAAGTSPGELRWLPPIPRPPKIVCTFANNPEISVTPLVEQDRWPRPLFFLKAPTSVVGPGEPIVIPAGIGVVQPEAELAVVIGMRMKRVPAEAALQHIFGYTLLNDVTAASLSLQDAVTLGIPGESDREQFPMRPMGRYKGLDTFGPLGPYVAPRWEVPEPETIMLTTRLNGEIVQRGRVADMRFDIGTVLAEASRWVTLEPGDVVSMGTVKQAPGWPLRKPDLGAYGGLIEVSGEPIGSLANPVVNEGSDTTGHKEGRS
jgi:2-keto-4-pentenoate hydratase/2-oxohepta-3-ene-1,7-dioic acid hydratase in catechol pathway